MDKYTRKEKRKTIKSFQACSVTAKLAVRRGSDYDWINEGNCDG